MHMHITPIAAAASAFQSTPPSRSHHHSSVGGNGTTTNTSWGTSATGGARTTGTAGNGTTGGSGANGELAMYWGSGDGRPLADYCTSTEGANIIVLSFLDSYGYGATASGAIGDCTIGSDGSGDGCSDVISGINTCHTNGIKVFVSLGGGGGSGKLQSEADGKMVASALFNSWARPEDSAAGSPRPLGDAYVDGWDLDVENPDGANYYQYLVDELRTSFSNTTNPYYISSAPQCYFESNGEDYNLGPSIQNSVYDYLFIQFYDNPSCEAFPTDGSFNYDKWATYIQGTDSKTAKLLIGLPASPVAADSAGYVPPEKLPTLLNKYKTHASFGGVMLWEASESDKVNDNGCHYSQEVHAVLTTDHLEDPSPRDDPLGTNAGSKIQFHIVTMTGQFTEHDACLSPLQVRISSPDPAIPNNDRSQELPFKGLEDLKPEVPANGRNHIARIRRRRKHYLSLTCLFFCIAIVCVIMECFAQFNIEYCDGEDLINLYFGVWSITQLGGLIAILGVIVYFCIVLGDVKTPSWAVALGTPVLVFAALGWLGHHCFRRVWKKCIDDSYDKEEEEDGEDEEEKCRNNKWRSEGERGTNFEFRVQSANAPADPAAPKTPTCVALKRVRRIGILEKWLGGVREENGKEGEERRLG
ncbi:hypothetical protein B7494_g667 [Chlorociboria aeruginascens]|nr:hypothetical protein B7494_g667 [Chlorociboria aeruginascens]